MGWPRKNEGARIYRNKGGRYTVIFPSDGCDRWGCWNPKMVGAFKGDNLNCWELLDRQGITVVRDPKMRKVAIQYHGYTQLYMGYDDPLPFPINGELSIKVKDARDSGIVQGFLLIHKWGIATDPVRFRGGVPQTFGGSAKRVSWDQVPLGIQEKLMGILPDKPEKIRGFWRIKDMPNAPRKIAQLSLPIK